MFRKQTTGGAREHKDRITWRSHEVTRIEAFSDAVFAFAITLLIVSLEVPKSFEELLKGMRSFLPFAVCFAMIFQVWMVQNIFFRRYGLNDTGTMVLNGILLFTVLFFVYPLKFLFSLLFLQGHGFSLSDAGQIVKLFYIYSGGYAAIYLLFTAMYWNAFRHRKQLALTGSEIFETKTNIYRNLAMSGIGLVSMAIASFGAGYTMLAGLIYILIGPALSLIHGIRGKRHRLKHEAGPVAETATQL